MNALTVKQIWDEVFDGEIQTASDWTRRHRDLFLESNKSAFPCIEPLILYLEPSLVSNHGHQLNLAICYKQVLQELGYRTFIAHSLKNSLPAEADWLPYFLVQHHTMASRNISSSSELDKVRHYFLNEFKEIVGQYNPRVCILPTVRFTNIVAAAEAMVLCNVQCVIFGVMEAGDVPDCQDLGIVRSAFSRAATLLQEQGISHLLVAETEQVSDFLVGCGFRVDDVKVYPYVAAKLITDVPSVPRKGTKKVRVGYLGGSRSVRHPELIADLITSGSIPDSVSLCVQLNLKYIKSKRGQNICDKIVALNKIGSIELCPPNLSQQEYRSLFDSLDFVILPYGERYQQIGSGIFFEAIYTGVIPIIAQDSNMSKVYDSLGGKAPCFNSLSAEAIRDAIVDGVYRFTALREATIAVRDNWRQHPSSAEQWQCKLTEWLPTHYE